MDNPNKELNLPDHCTPLVRYGNYVLAKREFEALEKPMVEYITWNICYDGSVTLGHYFGDDLPSAQEDFAKRSELVSEAKLFNADEYAVLNRALTEYEYSGAINYDDPKLWKHIENIRFKFDRIKGVDFDKYMRIKALIIEPGKQPYEKSIICEPHTHSDEVGGCTKISYPFKDTVVVLSNDKGEKSDLPFNRKVGGESFYGNMIIVDMNGEFKPISLSQEQIKKYTESFSHDTNRDAFEQSVDRAVEKSDIKTTPKDEIGR